MKKKSIKISLLYVVNFAVLMATVIVFNSGCAWFNQEKNYQLPKVALNQTQLKLVDSRLSEIEEEVNLEKKQISKVKEFLKIYATNILAIRKSKYSGAIKIKLAKEQLKKFESSLQGILTKDQYKQYLLKKKERYLNYYRNK